jgi:hypothetical protein
MGVRPNRATLKHFDTLSAKPDKPLVHLSVFSQLSFECPFLYAPLRGLGMVAARERKATE